MKKQCQTKGQILSIFGIVVIIMIVVFVFISSLGIFILAKISGGVKYELNLENIIITPYAVAEILTQHRINDRPILEHGIDMIVTGNVEGRKELKEIMEKFNGFGKYNITIRNGQYFSMGVEENEFMENYYGKAEIPLFFKSKLGYLILIFGKT